MAYSTFIQGPMTRDEADELASRYRSMGRTVTITPSFNIGLYLVQVRLPEMKFVPKPSIKFQQKIWR